jgi:hypothetical protein
MGANLKDGLLLRDNGSCETPTPSSKETIVMIDVLPVKSIG